MCRLLLALISNDQLLLVVSIAFVEFVVPLRPLYLVSFRSCFHIEALKLTGYSVGPNQPLGGCPPTGASQQTGIDGDGFET